MKLQLNTRANQHNRVHTAGVTLMDSQCINSRTKESPILFKDYELAKIIRFTL